MDLRFSVDFGTQTNQHTTKRTSSISTDAEIFSTSDTLG